MKSLFDTTTFNEVIQRLNSLTPQSQRQWGKMDVAQMLAHCQMPLGVATGDHKLKGSFFLRLIGPLFKSQLFNDKPFKRDLPTDISFKIADKRDFETEKQKLIVMIDHFSETSMSGEPHPFFGKLTKTQWSKGTWKHLNHHLAQFDV